MSATVLAPVTRPSGWEETLRSLEMALADGDPTTVSSIAIPTTLGPVPPELTERAGIVLDAIRSLERVVDDQLDAVSDELNRRSARHRRTAPPAPSQLDCSA